MVFSNPYRRHFEVSGMLKSELTITHPTLLKTFALHKQDTPGSLPRFALNVWLPHDLEMLKRSIIVKEIY